MRNSGFKMILFISFILGMILLATGCATPKHSNVLIFGTNTKLALDLSADTTGNPGITIGYARQEAVWMPLLANTGKDYEPSLCATENCLYRGTEDNDKDTYSVLASFGAKFSAEYTGTSPKAGGGLAQYFATGLAARKLAEIGGAKIVSVQPTEIYYEEVSKQSEESLGILRCYIGVKEEDLTKVWEDANKRGLLREDSFKNITDSYEAKNLRKAHKRYASDIYISEGTDKTRVSELQNHRQKVCELSRKNN